MLAEALVVTYPNIGGEANPQRYAPQLYLVACNIFFPFMPKFHMKTMLKIVSTESTGLKLFSVTAFNTLDFWTSKIFLLKI